MDGEIDENRIDQNVFALFLPRCLVMRWKSGPLPARKCAHKLEHVHNRQCSLLEGAKSPVQVWEYMLDPILHLMERKLVKNGKRHLTRYLPNYISFRMAVGMITPLRINDIWDPDALAHNPRLSKLISRKNFWEVHRYARPNVAKLLARCNKQWADAWVVGAFVAGDKAVAPSTGKGPMRMFIPRKPRATGVKLYVVADSTAPYVVDMYMYQGKCHVRGARKYGCVGRYTSREVVNHGGGVPQNTTLVWDRFFGNHRTADSLANR